MEDIQAALRKKEEDEEKKIKSPYTIIPKDKFNFWPIVYVILGILLLMFIIYIIINNIEKSPERVDELKSKEVLKYEFTN